MELENKLRYAKSALGAMSSLKTYLQIQAKTTPKR